MTPVKSLISLISLTATYVIPSVFLLRKTSRKKYFLLRFFLPLIAGMAIIYFIPQRVELGVFKFSPQVFLLYSLVVGVILFSYNTNLKTTIIIVLTSALLQHIGYNLRMILFEETGLNEALSFDWIYYIGKLVDYAILALQIFIVTMILKLSNSSLDEISYKSYFVVLFAVAGLLAVIFLSFDRSYALIEIIYDTLLCLTLLFINIYTNKTYVSQKMYEASIVKQNEQYEFLLASFDAIDRRMHDLKYYVNAIENGDNEERKKIAATLKEGTVDFEKLIYTGNSVIDSILSEKSVVCENYKIKFIISSNLSDLSFMDSIDIYIIFGNLLDNAIESQKLVPQDKRYITIHSKKEKNIVFILIENYLDHRIEFKNDLPKTTKKDKYNHGFGIRNVKKTLEKYDGELLLSQKQNVFQATIMLPLKDETSSTQE